MASRTRGKKVGVYMIKKKDVVDSLIETAQRQNRSFSVINFDPEAGVEVDLLVAKFTDDFPFYDKEEKSKKALDFFRSIENRVKIIDSMESQKIVSERLLLNSKLTKMDNRDICNPKYYMINEEADIEQAMKVLNFPVIMKLNAACGFYETHQMAIIFNLEQLKANISYPSFVQEYYNHDGVIYKCSVIGDYYSADPAPSTKNYNAAEQSEPVIFNSQHMSHITEPEAYKTAPPLSTDLLKEVATLLNKTIGLTLFGFDLVINTATGKAAVIDINFFPSYRKVSNANEKILDFVENVLNSQNK